MVLHGPPAQTHGSRLGSTPVSCRTGWLWMGSWPLGSQSLQVPPRGFSWNPEATALSPRHASEPHVSLGPRTWGGRGGRGGAEGVGEEGVILTIHCLRMKPTWTIGREAISPDGLA